MVKFQVEVFYKDLVFTIGFTINIKMFNQWY